MKAIINRTRLTVVVTAVGLAGLLPTLAKAEPPPDLVNSILRTQQQAAKAPKGQTVAMVCTKCRTVLLSDENTKRGFLGWFEPKTKHLCPGCGGYWGYVVYGKGSRHGDYVHTCSKCGAKSVFCCATKGSKRAPGM